MIALLMRGRITYGNDSGMNLRTPTCTISEVFDIWRESGRDSARW